MPGALIGPDKISSYLARDYRFGLSDGDIGLIMGN